MPCLTIPPFIALCLPTTYKRRLIEVWDQSPVEYWSV